MLVGGLPADVLSTPTTQLGEKESGQCWGVFAFICKRESHGERRRAGRLRWFHVLILKEMSLLFVWIDRSKAIFVCFLKKKKKVGKPSLTHFGNLIRGKIHSILDSPALDLDFLLLFPLVPQFKWVFLQNFFRWEALGEYVTIYIFGMFLLLEWKK